MDSEDEKRQLQEKLTEKLIEDHKQAELLVEEFDRMAENGHLHRLPDSKKLPGLPSKGFCLICMKGNKEMAESLWTDFSLNYEAMYSLCALYNLYTEVLNHNKFNVGEWILNLLKKGLPKMRKEYVDILRHALYYAAYLGNITACDMMVNELKSLESKDVSDEKGDEKEEINSRLYVNNAFLYAAKMGKNDTCKSLLKHGISTNTVNHAKSQGYLRGFTIDTPLEDYTLDLVDTNKKITYISTEYMMV